MIKRLLLILILFLGCVRLSAQIQGVVVDADSGDPLPYLNVYYEGKGVGTITDIDGNYSISSHPGWTKLTFSMVVIVPRSLPCLRRQPDWMLR